MLYTYPVTLSARGGELVARELLPVLRTFESRQIVSVGYTAIPLLAACVQHSRGEFTGACVRETRKAHGSRRRIEGMLDRGRPVIVVDDSISSGKSIRSGILALEDEGFDVEGVVGLVHFPWRGGVERARAHGYRVETVFDIWRDIGMPLASHVHGHQCVGATWSEKTASDGLHPASVARAVAAELLEANVALRPPAEFDRAYDGRGGVFVSFRDRETEERLARSGFWHFDPDEADAARDVVLATVKTVEGARARLKAHGLGRLKIAVSFLGPLTAAEPCDVDFDRLGVVVQSVPQRGKVGGALPHTQVFTSDVEQYRHAAFRNARLGRTEPYELFVHTVSKFPEPGCYWLPYGATGDDADQLPLEVGRRLTERAAEVLESHAAGRAPAGAPLDDDLVPDPLFGVAVTLYRNGVYGCCVSSAGGLDECLVRATRNAAEDPRFRDGRASPGAADTAISVTLLRDRELLGTSSDLDRALVKARPGHDAVGVSDDRRSALFLPQVGVHYDWSRATLARQLLRKAKIAPGPAAWTAYRTSGWVRGTHGVHALRQGFPERDAPVPSLPTLRSTLETLCGYLVGQLQPNGFPAYSYAPVFDRTELTGTAGRVLHALTALADAGNLLNRPDFVAAAESGIRQALETVHVDATAGVSLPGLSGSLGADAELLLGLVALGLADVDDPRVAHIHNRLLETVRPDGRVAASARRLLRAEHDFLPGLVLLALASVPARLPDLASQLAWYERRFDLVHPWGMVGWHPQAWRQIWEAGQRHESIRGFVRRMLDWALARQSRSTGAFLTDLNLFGPSFHTAFVMEGVADGARLLLTVHEPETAERYLRAWRQGFVLLDRLIIREVDTFCMRDPVKAVGGVRGTLTSATVRVDFVSHAVQAIVKALRYAQSSRHWKVETHD
jgi:orotate phosphoribosyltransferase/AMMECR1 domain-containing protein